MQMMSLIQNCRNYIGIYMFVCNSCLCVWEREWVRVCVCVRERVCMRERQTERERGGRGGWQERESAQESKRQRQNERDRERDRERDSQTRDLKETAPWISRSLPQKRPRRACTLNSFDNRGRTLNTWVSSAKQPHFGRERPAKRI